VLDENVRIFNSLY